jgi:hypothetical protein
LESWRFSFYLRYLPTSDVPFTSIIAHTEPLSRFFFWVPKNLFLGISYRFCSPSMHARRHGSGEPWVVHVQDLEFWILLQLDEPYVLRCFALLREVVDAMAAAAIKKSSMPWRA